MLPHHNHDKSAVKVHDGYARTDELYQTHTHVFNDPRLMSNNMKRRW